MRKIIIIGSLVGLQTFRAACRGFEFEAARLVLADPPSAVALEPKPALPDASGPPVPYDFYFYGRGRKGKGEKKRAASARRGKGWI